MSVQRGYIKVMSSGLENALQQQPRRPVRRSTDGDVIQKTNQRLGYRNNWHRQQVDLSKSFSFSQAFPLNPQVAIIGGGLAGLICGQELASRGIRATVFDTGEHGVGGRLATRRNADKSLHKAPATTSSMVFDHAAQYFTATDPRFMRLVEEWEADAAVKEWTGPVGNLRKGQFRPLPANPKRYVGAQGMRLLATYIADSAKKKYPNLLQVVRPMWVARMQGVTTNEGEQKWDLQGGGRSQGLFDAVVIAHNGKCANRLVGNAGSPHVAKQLMSLQLSAVWAVMVAFPQAVRVPSGMEGAFVYDDPVLAWASNNSAKLGLGQGLQCWTFITTKQYGKKNKVPQEAVPAEVAQKVIGEVLEAFERALGLRPGDLPSPVFGKAQLWGAALPLNTPNVECIFDPDTRVGVCGDWLLGGSMQAAAVSGIALADKISQLQQGPCDLEQVRIGLTAEFTPLKATDIGEFPSGNAAPRQQQNVAVAVQVARS